MAWQLVLLVVCTLLLAVRSHADDLLERIKLTMFPQIIVNVSIAINLPLLPDEPSPYELVLPKAERFLHRRRWKHIGVYSLNKSFTIDFLHASQWAYDWPSCNGLRQSPINLQACCMRQYDTAIWRDIQQQPLAMILVNNGNTVQLQGEWPTSPVLIGGGNLPYRGLYTFSDITFHWSAYGTGSEHTINGKRYPMEMQLVFYKAKGNRDAMDAVNNDDHIAIISILIEVSDDDNENFNPIMEALPFIRKPRSLTSVEPFSIDTLFPKNIDYFMYSGSLTIPPCSETVTWLVFANTVSISEKQLAKFKHIRDGRNQLVRSNSRVMLSRRQDRITGVDANT